MNHVNNTSVTLMVWEVNPSKRNVNNIIKFVAQSDKKINVGDKILGSLIDSASKRSTYEITKILNRRKANVKGHDYYEVESKWTAESLN